MAVTLAQMAKSLLDSKAEAVVLKADQMPSVRTGTAVFPISGQTPLTNQELEQFCLSFIERSKIVELTLKKKLELSTTVDTLGTFKVLLAMEGFKYSCQLMRMPAGAAPAVAAVVASAAAPRPAVPPPAPVGAPTTAPRPAAAPGGNGAPNALRQSIPSGGAIPGQPPGMPPNAMRASIPPGAPVPGGAPNPMRQSIPPGAPVPGGARPPGAPGAPPNAMRQSIPPGAPGGAPNPMRQSIPPGGAIPGGPHPGAAPNAMRQSIPPGAPAPGAPPLPPRVAAALAARGAALPAPAPAAPPAAPAPAAPAGNAAMLRAFVKAPPRPTLPDALEFLEELMGALLEGGGSDIHLKQGRLPILRLDGELTKYGTRLLTPEVLWSFVNIIAKEEAERDLLATNLQLDSAYAFKDRARFRSNMYNDVGGLGMALRIIPSKIPKWEDLGVPKQARDLVYRPHGLILVTGPTGSGKTTTLASLIRDINEKEYKHIITIEDPIEFMFPDDRSSVTQREVGVDTPSFAIGVVDALRQDPDVILVGELRDIETMSAAFVAAEAGKLVLATCHTTSAYQTIERILNAFPAEQQPQVRFQLAATLNGIISQSLLPKKGGGRVAAIELMIANDAIRASIRDAKPQMVQGAIETGAAVGMRTLDQHLAELLENGKVTYEHAFEKCQNPANFGKLEAKFRGGAS